MGKYLDSAGLTYLWSKIKDYIASHGGGLGSKLYTGTCPTAAGTAAKVVTLDDATGFSLTAGVMVAVSFTYGNTATTPTMNVNSTGAKTIAIPSSATAFTTGSGTTYNTWGARETIIFTYTGTYWSHLPSGRLGYLAYNGLSSKANLASPTFTGTPEAPTAAAGTNTTQLATTAFVKTAVDNAVSPSTEVLDITPLTPSGVSSVAYIRVSRCGKMVHVQGMLTLASTAPSSAVTIATGLPVPPYNVIVEGIADASSYTSFKRNLDVRVTTGGNLTVRYGAASTIYVFNLAYLEA